jgi:hypothetical protein
MYALGRRRRSWRDTLLLLPGSLSPTGPLVAKRSYTETALEAAPNPTHKWPLPAARSAPVAGSGRRRVLRPQGRSQHSTTLRFVARIGADGHTEVGGAVAPAP